MKRHVRIYLSEGKRLGKKEEGERGRVKETGVESGRGRGRAGGRLVEVSSTAILRGRFRIGHSSVTLKLITFHALSLLLPDRCRCVRCVLWQLRWFDFAWPDIGLDTRAPAETCTPVHTYVYKRKLIPRRAKDPVYIVLPYLIANAVPASVLKSGYVKIDYG